MSPRRNPLLQDVPPGRARSAGDKPETSSGRRDTQPTPATAQGQPGHEHLADARGHTAALRERLSQTRARIAQTHSQPPPNVRVDWDPEEPPTRLYQGESMPMPMPNRPSRHSAVTSPAPHSAGQGHAPFRRQLPGQDPSLPAPTAPAAPLPPSPEPYAHTDERVPRRRVVSPSASPHHTPAVSERPSRADLATDRRDAARDWLERAASRWLALPTHYRRNAFIAGCAVVLMTAGFWIIGGTAKRGVLVETSPPDARVTLDGSPLATGSATSPFEKEDIEPGNHQLVIEKPGFITQRRKLTLTQDNPHQQLSVTLSPLPQTANVSVSSTPAGAQIYVDGKDSGKVTPASLTDLALGQHLVSLKLEGYAEAAESMRLPADARLSIALASTSAQRRSPTSTGPAAPTVSRSEARLQARELARERRAAARAAKVMIRYREKMGLPPDPVAQELVDAYGPLESAVP